MIGYRYDDGGRATAGFKGHTGDCVVRAIAIITGVPYADIYRRMAAAMRHGGYSASGNGYRQKARRGLRPRMSARKIQNLVKTSYGLRRVNLGRGPRPTHTEAWLLHGDCLVGTARHISAVVDETLCDTFDSRIYDTRLYGGSAAEERKAQPVWIIETLCSGTGAIPEFDPTQLIRPPACRP